MEKSIDKPRRTALARGLFAASLAAVAAAAVSPDWAATLKAQGYYGSVDLGVTLTPSQTPRAGEAVDFLVSVTNAGPDAANRVRTIAGAQNLHVIETDGCAADPLGYPHCALPSPLAAGASGDYLLRMRVPPSARGTMQLSVSVTSDEDETAPGDEVALFKAPIVAAVDMAISMQCDADAFVGPTGRVACEFEVRNDGPSAPLTPFMYFVASNVGGVSWSCESTRPFMCLGATTAGNSYNIYPSGFEPGDILRVRGEIVPWTGLGNPVAVLSGLVNTTDWDPDPGNEYVSREFDVVLFRDDFEPTSTSPRP